MVLKLARFVKYFLFGCPQFLDHLRISNRNDNSRRQIVNYKGIFGCVMLFLFRFNLVMEPLDWIFVGFFRVARPVPFFDKRSTANKKCTTSWNHRKSLSHIIVVLPLSFDMRNDCIEKQGKNEETQRVSCVINNHFCCLK